MDPPICQDATTRSLSPPGSRGASRLRVPPTSPSGRLHKHKGTRMRLCLASQFASHFIASLLVQGIAMCACVMFCERERGEREREGIGVCLYIVLV